jgi:sugar/nucleoside kinase (ribokinase family)
MDYATFGIIIDDLERADGLSRRGLLGGGGPQSAFGIRLWSESVGLVARVGTDLPATAWQWLRESGIDTQAIQITSWPTLRALQRLDQAGKREHIWLVPEEAVGGNLRRTIVDLPAAYKAARGWHLGVHPDAPDLDFIAALRSLGGAVSLETFRPAAHALSPAALRRLLEAAHIFSPNRLSAGSLVGPGAPEAMAARLLAAGARVLALRLGARGSLVAEARTRQAAWIPALPVTVVDAVGAGNAYCGAFLTGWVETANLVEAGLRGAAAASLVIEHFGVPVMTPELRQQARARLQTLRSMAKVVSLG